MTDRIDTAQERRRLVGNEAVLHRIPSYLDAIDAERAENERLRAEIVRLQRQDAAARLCLDFMASGDDEAAAMAKRAVVAMDRAAMNGEGEP